MATQEAGQALDQADGGGGAAHAGNSAGLQECPKGRKRPRKRFFYPPESPLLYEVPKEYPKEEESPHAKAEECLAGILLLLFHFLLFFLVVVLGDGDP